jgi:tetrapyrrole methylase family protein/MazG family protein
LLEETYEVLAALDDEDNESLCEELGDLLMQVAMHVQIATEEGSFKFADVISGIDAKLKRRHPHVFGDLEVTGTAEVLHNWETIKEHERAEKGQSSRSRMEGVPVSLPALARAQALSNRAARDGFDWPNVDGVLEKLGEEVGELQAASDLHAQASEVGDIFFALVNVARWLGIDAESALRATCGRFTRRYGEMERLARSRNLHLSDLSPAELETLWQKTKADESRSALE